MIIGITGTIGAGKGLIASYFEKKGFRHISVSGFLAEEAARRGLAPTRVVRREIANEYRTKGPSALIEAVLADANPLKENIVIESLHTVPEVEYVQRLSGKVISVDAPLLSRWERIKKAGGTKDTDSYDAFVAEQNHQMSSENLNENNLGKAMKAADFHFENTGAPEEIFGKIDVILQNL
ncbi:MAG: dephospho-CoA kinase [bacterium]|nr:dephospho-CoA kinase [bacterium]